MEKLLVCCRCIKVHPYVGKGYLSINFMFPFFLSQCFQKTSAAEASESVERSSIKLKTFGKRGKLLMMSNFAFCHNVFKSLPHLCYNTTVCGLQGEARHISITKDETFKAKLTTPLSSGLRFLAGSALVSGGEWLRGLYLSLSAGEAEALWKYTVTINQYK